jgi:hypothetical protein
MFFTRPIPIPMEDDLVHTDDAPFCADPTCPDKEDPDLLAAVAQQVEDGLLTPDEATRFVQGRQL